MTERLACFPKRLSWSAVADDVITPACSDYKYLYSAELHNNGCWIIVSTPRQKRWHSCHRKYIKRQNHLKNYYYLFIIIILLIYKKQTLNLVLSVFVDNIKNMIVSCTWRYKQCINDECRFYFALLNLQMFLKLASPSLTGRLEGIPCQGSSCMRLTMCVCWATPPGNVSHRGLSTFLYLWTSRFSPQGRSVRLAQPASQTAFSSYDLIINDMWIEV